MDKGMVVIALAVVVAVLLAFVGALITFVLETHKWYADAEARLARLERPHAARWAKISRSDHFDPVCMTWICMCAGRDVGVDEHGRCGRCGGLAPTTEAREVWWRRVLERRQW